MRGEKFERLFPELKKKKEKEFLQIEIVNTILRELIKRSIYS